MDFFVNLINVGPKLRMQGLGENSKLINVGPTFIPDYRVNRKSPTGCRWNLPHNNGVIHIFFTWSK